MSCDSRPPAGLIFMASIVILLAGCQPGVLPSFEPFSSPPKSSNFVLQCPPGTKKVGREPKRIYRGRGGEVYCVLRWRSSEIRHGQYADWMEGGPFVPPSLSTVGTYHNGRKSGRWYLWPDHDTIRQSDYSYDSQDNEIEDYVEVVPDDEVGIETERVRGNDSWIPDDVRGTTFFVCDAKVEEKRAVNGNTCGIARGWWDLERQHLMWEVVREDDDGTGRKRKVIAVREFARDGTQTTPRGDRRGLAPP